MYFLNIYLFAENSQFAFLLKLYVQVGMYHSLPLGRSFVQEGRVISPIIASLETIVVKDNFITDRDKALLLM